ncbi:cysteine-rich venom protein-like [Lacerta agilis]|uniref:cysteine-rich venom protein-like n=1 Tax=Lacerta agilis TaxID=80427 RepID=UPI001419954B|nr:cysteine-rich venom protein-like [Lacerta agilis]
MIVLLVSLSLAALLEQPASRAHALGVGPAEQKQILDKHNALRREVKPTASNMLKMEWSPDATANAERWAKKCLLGHSPQDQRIVDGFPCGENIFASSQPTSWNDVIQDWYDEVEDFQYGVGAVRPGAVTGHYTQVVWYRSYKIGCYAAHCPENRLKYLYFCQYCPAGNLQGSLETPYKSGPPCEDCPNACDNGLCTNPCKYTDIGTNCPELAESYGCKNQNILRDCPASCLCTNEIK